MAEEISAACASSKATSGARVRSQAFSPVFTAAQDEADQFAKEAETGQHGGMGLGDVKLAVGLGGMLGPGLATLSLGFATAFGAITGIALAAKHGRSLRIGLPFVPFMAIGAIVAQLYGAQVVAWYSRFLNPEPPRVLSPGELRRLEKQKERDATPGARRTPAEPTTIRGNGESVPTPRR